MSDDTTRTLGELIRNGRTAKRITLRALARMLDVSAPYMSDVEHNRRALSPKRLEQVILLLGLDRREVESAVGWSRDLAAWIKGNPDLVRLLNEMRAGRSAGLTECDCAACFIRRECR